MKNLIYFLTTIAVISLAFWAYQESFQAKSALKNIKTINRDIKKSQEILQGFFEIDVVTLIPPGNVYCNFTIEAAKKYGIKYINCQTPSQVIDKVAILSNDNVYAFHDKEIVQEGLNWFEGVLKKYQSYQHVFVKELN